MKFSRRKFHEGFTLLEILVAITILGIVMATILGTFTGIIAGSRDAEKKVELYQIGRVVMDLIATDIRGLYPVALEGAGAFFLGEEETLGGQSVSRMDFITTNTLTMGARQNPFLSEVGYRLKRDPADERIALWRRSQAPTEYPFDTGGREVPVCRIIESFSLEFVHNGDRKRSLLYVFPEAIVIDMTLNLDGERERFVTMVRPMATPVKRKSE